MRILLASVVLFASFGSAQAQGLVQLGLSGAITTSGGALVEVQVVVPRGENDVPISVALFLAEKTSAADLAALLANRLERAEVRVLFPGKDGPPRPISALFLENVLAVSLLVGNGLEATVTLGQEAPASIRLVPPLGGPKFDALRLESDKCTLGVTTATLHPHTKERLRRELHFAFAPNQGVTEIANLLARGGTAENWICEVQGHDAWGLIGFHDGSTSIGMNLELCTRGDWRLEVGLTKKVLTR